MIIQPIHNAGIDLIKNNPNYDYEIIENKRKDGFDKHRFVGEQIVKLVPIKDMDQKKLLKDPRTNERPVPGFLNADADTIKSFDHRLDELASWVTSHPRFAKVQANRIWANLMGQPLIDPVDDWLQRSFPAIS